MFENSHNSNRWVFKLIVSLTITGTVSLGAIYGFGERYTLASVTSPNFLDNYKDKISPENDFGKDKNSGKTPQLPTLLTQASGGGSCSEIPGAATPKADAITWTDGNFKIFTIGNNINTLGFQESGFEQEAYSRGRSLVSLNGSSDYNFTGATGPGSATSSVGTFSNGTLTFSTTYTTTNRSEFRTTTANSFISGSTGHGVYIFPEQGGTANNSYTVSIDFTTPVTAFSLDLVDIFDTLTNNNPIVSYEVYVDGQLIAYFNGPFLGDDQVGAVNLYDGSNTLRGSPNTGQNIENTIGFVTDTPVSNVSIRHVINSGSILSTARDPHGIDRFTYSTDLPLCDYSDTPEDGQSSPNGGTTGYGDATHIIVNGIKLGLNIDNEITAQNSANADGDDNDSDGDDDDGINIPTTLTVGQIAKITANVTGTGGYLQGWIDWDGDGSFDPGEQVATDIQDNSAEDSNPTLGTVEFDVTVPAGAITSADTFARFRWSTTQGLDSTTDASDGEVEDYQVAIAAPPSISGTVFEDINYGGGAGRNFATSEASATGSGFAVNGTNATGINNVRVELYSYDGLDTSTSKFIEATATDNDGNYSFDVTNGNYLVRVVNNTFESLRPVNPIGFPQMAVQTFRNDPDETITEITNEVGGAHPAVIDSGNVTTVNTPLPNDAQSVTTININGSSVSQVDFGFNFSTIVNTNDSGQGSLRQFLANSNRLANTNLAQDLPPAITPPLDKDGNAVNLKNFETSIFMIPDPSNDSRVIAGTGVGQINLTSVPPDGGSGSAFVIDTSSSFQPMRILDSNTSIDGRTQTINIPTVMNTANRNIGSNETTGAEIILEKRIGGDMIYGQFNNLIFHSLGIFSHPNTTDSVGLLISNNGSPFSPAINTSNVIMSDLTIATSNCGIQGAKMVDSVIRNSVIRDSAGSSFSCDNVELLDNSHRNRIEDNLILRSAQYGIDLNVNGNLDNLIQNNQIVGNGTSNSNNQTSGINVHIGSQTTINNNIIRDNVGDGITITNDSANNIGNLISQNSIYNNGDLGIDLGGGNAGDGVTSNDPSDGDPGANGLQNFPVITNIISDGTNYTIEGSLETTPSDNLEIELYSNAVCNPDTNGAAQTDNYGEGEKYHTTIAVTTDSSGQATFATTVAISDLAGNVITTTATSQTSNDTSEFSQCFTTTPELVLVKRITNLSPNPNSIDFTAVVDDGVADSSDDDPNWQNEFLQGQINVADVQPGDEVEYTIYFLSNGIGEVNNVKICDVVPDNMSFVENGFDNGKGIRLLFDSTTQDLSNIANDDQGEFYSPNNAPPTFCQKIDPTTGNLISVDNSNNNSGAVVVELDNPLPSATSSGTPPGSYGYIRFRVRVQ